MKEIWKDIYGFEDLYMVSNYGFVKSKAREVTTNDKRGYSYITDKKEKILKNICNKNGYAKVSLHKDGVQYQKNVHRLVAEHFIQNVFNLPQINHIDGNKHNPKVDNLEWVTHSENCLHAHKTGLSKAKSILGIENKRSKRVKQILPNGKIKIWDSMMSAQRHGYSSASICRVCKGISKTHKGSKWEYTDENPTEKTINGDNTFYNNEVLKKLCVYCNKEFETTSQRKISCSRKCAKKHYNKKYYDKKKDNQ
jgi:hypothetical protein